VAQRGKLLPGGSFGLKMTLAAMRKGGFECLLTRISQSWNNNIALWKRK
jgi:hypothetical protein